MNPELLLNCIVIHGVVHTLIKQSEVSVEHWTNNPCDICSLKQVCQRQEGHLCSYFDASQEEFFKEFAYAATRVSLDLLKF